jgi:hypothetical protein
MAIDLPLAAVISESYIGDINLRLSLYQRMAAAKGDDAAADLERELRDRFGPPPAPVRNLLYVVRVRTLAQRAGLMSVAREDAAGRPMLVLRAPAGEDLRGRLRFDDRHRFERDDAVALGRAQVRIDLEAAGDRWRDLLLELLAAVRAGELAPAQGAAPAV